MAEKTNYATPEIHRWFGVELFNGTWGLLDKEGRTPEEDARLIHMVHASRYHWGEVGTPLEFSRGEQLISHVYALLKMPAPALYHAQLTLTLCEKHGYGDFDLAFAYEAMARAYAVAGEAAKRDEYVARGRQAAEGIAKPEDREYFLAELASIP